MSPLLALLVAAAVVLAVPGILPAAPADKRWDTLIIIAAQSNNVHPALLKAIVEVESNYNPDAMRDEGSGRVSVGLAQILWPDTAQGLGFPGTVDQLKDPMTNLYLAGRLLRELLDRHGTVPAVVSHYNCTTCVHDRPYTRQVMALYTKYWEGF